MPTKQKIIAQTRRVFAREGEKSLGLREIAEKTGIVTSVLYYYFPDKDALLKAMFDETNTQLGILRAKLPKVKNAGEMLKQRIGFQLDHAEMIIAVLKYYLKYRKTFEKRLDGFVPEKASLHIFEVLDYGTKSGEFKSQDIASDAKVITHAINGFVMEYYPAIPGGRERKKLVNLIYNFIIRALRPNAKGGENK